MALSKTISIDSGKGTLEGLSTTLFHDGKYKIHSHKCETFPCQSVHTPKLKRFLQSGLKIETDLHTLLAYEDQSKECPYWL